MKNFFAEFKKFITRGNVMDMAVGIIIGGAFTAIVTALTTYILTPIINWVIYLIFGGTADQPVYTFLVGNVNDLENAIYINWGAFIAAIINFLLIAFVLFSIVKTINSVKEKNEKLKAQLFNGKLSKEDKKELKARGIKRSDKAAVNAYLDEKAKAEQQAAEEEKAKQEAEELEAKKHSTEGLLEEIKALLEKNIK